MREETPCGLVRGDIQRASLS